MYLADFMVLWSIHSIPVTPPHLAFSKIIHRLSWFTREMQQMHPAQRSTTNGSRTITIHDPAPRELHPADPDIPEGTEDGNEDGLNRARQPVLVLNLEGGGNDVRRKKKAGQRVVWKEDVIDNEGAGKKKSKSLFHLPLTPAWVLTPLYSLLHISQAPAFRRVFR